MTASPFRPAWVEVDLGVIERNVAIMANEFEPSALCVAVKANGYGHGAVQVAQAALRAGARGAGVALVDEGVELREAGVEAPVLVLYEPDASAMDLAVRFRLTPVLCTADGVRAYADAVLRSGGHKQPVHLSIDTGMHREGADPAAFVELCALVAETQSIFVEGVSTHFSVADEPMNPFTEIQAERFVNIVKDVFPDFPPPFAHCCNTPAAILHPELRFDMVRCGGGVYGLASTHLFNLLPGMQEAMSVRAKVAGVRDLEEGETVSYGRQYRLKRRSRIATVPVGYGDGIPRSWWNRGAALIGGVRRPVAGTISMDYITVDCGSDETVGVGDEVVLLGGQGDERITTAEIADAVGTINYEITTRIGDRLPRRYVRTELAPPEAQD